jgi:hypothetical protein
MILTLIPQRGLPGQLETTIHVTGDVLTVDGIAYDLSAIPEGGEGIPEGEHPFAGPISREDGVLHASVIVRLDDTAAFDQPDSPWTVIAIDGPVAIPAARKPVEVPE